MRLDAFFVDAPPAPLRLHIREVIVQILMEGVFHYLLPVREAVEHPQGGAEAGVFV